MITLAAQTPPQVCRNVSQKDVASRKFRTVTLNIAECGIDILKSQDLRRCDRAAPAGPTSTHTNDRGRDPAQVDHIFEEIRPVGDLQPVARGDYSPFWPAANYLIDLGTLTDRMLILLNIDKLMLSDKIGLIGKLIA